jgi:hypothetical protein
MSSMGDNDNWVGLDSFVGGESQDTKFGGNFQYDYGRHVDIRRPGYFTILPGTAASGSGVVTDLVLDMTQIPDGSRYAVGDSGNVYRITTANVWSKIGNIGQTSGGGILYRPDNDMVYITGQTKVARIKTVSSTPLALDPNWFQYGISSATTCYKTGGTNSYALPQTTLLEGASNIRTFVSDIEPLIRIGVKPLVATGNWTMTIHDDANNSLGSVTVNAASLTVGQINYFTFTTPIRLFVSVNNYTSSSSGGRTYHFHLTSTVATDTVQTTTAGSLADADMELWANALVQPNNGLHPIYSFAQFTMFGNEKYIAAYEPLQDSPTTSDFLRHRITMPSGYENNGMAQLDLYLAATFEQRSTSPTQDFQSGKMILWDAIQTTYNRYFDIPEGSPEAIFSHKNVASFFAGGALWQSSGGQPVKVRTLRNTESTYSNIADSTHCYPHMMTVRRGILLLGYPSVTTNQSLEHAVYGYGRIIDSYPLSWTTSYTMSTGSILNNGTNNLRLGMVKNYGDTLYISWRDDSQTGSKYGVDIVNNSSAPASDFQMELLYYDYNKPYKEKLAKKALVTFDPLPGDGSISLRMWYKINNEATKHYSTDDGTPYVTSGTVCQVSIPKQYIGIKVGIEGTIRGSVPLFGRGFYIGFDPQPTRTEISQ